MAVIKEISERNITFIIFYPTRDMESSPCVRVSVASCFLWQVWVLQIYENG